MGRKPGKRYPVIMRVTEEERALILKHRSPEYQMPEPHAPRIGFNATTEADKALTEVAKGGQTRLQPQPEPLQGGTRKRTEPSTRCPSCGGLLGEFRKGKRVCQVCQAEVKSR
jgi:hypothetical protein